MSTLESIREEIESVNATLKEAKREGMKLDNPGVIAMYSVLSELYKKERYMLLSESGKSKECACRNFK